MSSMPTVSGSNKPQNNIRACPLGAGPFPFPCSLPALSGTRRCRSRQLRIKRLNVRRPAPVRQQNPASILRQRTNRFQVSRKTVIFLSGKSDPQIVPVIHLLHGLTDAGGIDILPEDTRILNRSSLYPGILRRLGFPVIFLPVYHSSKNTFLPVSPSILVTGFSLSGTFPYQFTMPSNSFSTASSLSALSTVIITK